MINHRNYTVILALQLFFCKHYKTDWTDDTIGMSPKAISAPNADFDGDSLYLSSLKEMTTVIDFLKIHPMTTLLGGEGEGLSPCVKMIDEHSISMHNYVTNNDSLDIERYYRMLNPVKKSA